MERKPNAELDRLILDHLSNKYQLKQKREGIHLSTLVYCLTRSFFDQLAPVEPTDEELMLWALGYGLQDVLTPANAETPTYEKDGIVFRPDFVLPLEFGYCELKTTRASLKKNKESLPETWIEYIMGGCYMQGVTEYQLSSLHLMGSYAPPFPELYSETLVFEVEELQDNWERIVNRRDIYQLSLATNQPPTPFTFNKDWECKNCRYKLQCEAMVMAEKFIKEEIHGSKGKN